MPLTLFVLLAAVASSALYAAAVALAPMAAQLLMLVPLPGLLVATRGTRSICSLWFGLAATTVAALLGSAAMPGFVLLAGIPTLIMASGIRRVWSFETTVLAGLAAWCLGLMGLTMLAYGDLPTLLATLRPQLASSVDMALSSYGSVAPPDTAAAVQLERDQLVSGLLEVLPAVAVLIGALTLILNLVMVRRWVSVTRATNLRLWRTPDVLIWILIATGFGMFCPVAPIALCARNLFLIVLGCYFCQGLAIVSYYLERFRLPRGIRVVGYVLIAVQHVIAALVLALGVFDLWGNFRRLGVGPADIRLRPEE